MKLLLVFIFTFFANASIASAGIISGITDTMKNVITLSEKAVFHHGGTLVDLFGELKSNIVSVPNDSGEFVDFDLRSDDFLKTGIDPFFDAFRDVFFVLYTKEDREGQIFSIKNVDNTTFNVANPVRVLIHGFMNNLTSPLNRKLTEAYLDEGDYNVIVTDWSYGAFSPLYLHSRLRVEPVSAEVASVINFLIAGNFTTHDQVVIVGHSLGGQTAGLTGKKIIGGKARAVIALDPAGPLFPPVPTQCSVAPTDAEYVEVTHCNGGGLGMLAACGQADFFPNGGSVQPGCGTDILSCPHSRCYEYFAESITNNKFVSEKCASQAEITVGKCTDQGGQYLMGGAQPNSGISGVFFLKTAAASPFALE